MGTMSFSERLKHARKQARKKLREIASETDLTISYISDLEHRRKKTPSFETIKKLEKSLETKENYLWEAAQKEEFAGHEIRKFINQRPELNLGLLRVAEGMTEEQIQEIIEVAQKMKST